ncbi:MAG: tetratricopeptide repeat protein [Erythrobacter sp.]
MEILECLAIALYSNNKADEMEQYSLEVRSDPKADQVEAAIRTRKDDIIRAIEELENLAGSGSVVAKLVLGDLYLYGWFDAPIDREKGEALLLEAKDLGSIEAAFRLACYYQKYVRNNEAIAVFEELADRSYSPAIYRLGLMYQEGLLAEMNPQESKRHLEKAAKLGHIPALKSLARMNATSLNPISFLIGLCQYLGSIVPHFRQLRTDRLSDNLRE